jgi:hypothetical protein
VLPKDARIFVKEHHDIAAERGILHVLLAEWVGLPERSAYVLPILLILKVIIMTLYIHWAFLFNVYPT